MKTFKEFMQESSLARIKSKSDKGGMAALSASRAGKSAKENRARAKQLDRDIRGRGLGGATKVTGSYVEKGDDGKEKRVKERSHVVTSGKMGKRKFKKTVKALGKKYGQDSVLTQTKKTGTLSATRKGGLGKAKNIKLGKFKAQVAQTQKGPITNQRKDFYIWIKNLTMTPTGEKNINSIQVTNVILNY